ncbi:reverse transcriptase domain-containing protein [Tanacetum coccineum]
MDLKQSEVTEAKSSIEEPPELDLKDLPSHLEYAILEENAWVTQLTKATILVVPDWNLPFELICDASDFAIGTVLRQRKMKHFQPIHYASKTMTEAQIITLPRKRIQESFVVVYAFEKFWPYLVLSKSIVDTDHSTLKLLIETKKTLSRGSPGGFFYPHKILISTIRDKKGVRTLRQEHLSRLRILIRMCRKQRHNEHLPFENSLGVISSESNPMVVAGLCKLPCEEFFITECQTQQREFFKEVKTLFSGTIPILFVLVLIKIIQQVVHGVILFTITGEFITTPPGIVREHEDYINRMSLLCGNSSSWSLENSHTIIESLPTSTTLIEDSDPNREEIDIFSGPDDSIPPGIESDFDSEEDIIDNLLNGNPIRECLTFNIKPDAPVINNVDELNEDECFDPGGGEINVEVDDSFTFVTWTFLPYLTYLEVSPLLSSIKNEDTIFDPGIST